jgi:hypothetical protein
MPGKAQPYRGKDQTSIFKDRPYRVKDRYEVYR